MMTPTPRLVPDRPSVTEEVIAAALNAQPLTGKNKALRVWQLFDNAEEASIAMKGALDAALAAMIAAAPPAEAVGANCLYIGDTAYVGNPVSAPKVLTIEPTRFRGRDEIYIGVPSGNGITVTKDYGTLAERVLYEMAASIAALLPNNGRIDTFDKSAAALAAPPAEAPAERGDDVERVAVVMASARLNWSDLMESEKAQFRDLARKVITALATAPAGEVVSQPLNTTGVVTHETVIGESQAPRVTGGREAAE